MTRRLFKTEDGWNVATGWDRMLGHFFLDISKDCERCNGDGLAELDANNEPTPWSLPCITCKGEGVFFAYNNLSDVELLPTMGGMTLKQVIAKFEQYITNWPQLIIVRLERDQRNNVGNEVVNYGVQGRMKNAESR